MSSPSALRHSTALADDGHGTFVGMSVTSVQTSAYTAHFGEIVLTDPTTAGAVVPVTLPTLGQGQGSVTVKRADLGSTGRTDSTCGTTSGSPVVTDASIVATDAGRPVTANTGVPLGCYVGTVIAGTSFRLSASPTSQVDVNATATGTVALTIGDLVSYFGTSVIGPMEGGASNDALNEFGEAVTYVPNSIVGATTWVRV